MVANVAVCVFFAGRIAHRLFCSWCRRCTSRSPGAPEARLQCSHHHFGIPRLCGAQGTGVEVDTRPSCCSHSSWHYGENNTYVVIYSCFCLIHQFTSSHLNSRQSYLEMTSSVVSSDLIKLFIIIIIAIFFIIYIWIVWVSFCCFHISEFHLKPSSFQRNVLLQMYLPIFIYFYFFLLGLNRL